ncbi:hypothetical protein [Actinomadura verrucosospora]|uniref:hypothetical protein n=1 Tax=Actinomadura verrucosospora TaxID=46165 RepID=UPI0015654C54|nr:hypothetical protein [Actinomadura verrucosospora]
MGDEPQLRQSVTDSPATAPTNRTAIPSRTWTHEKGVLNTPGCAAALLLLAVLGCAAIWQRKILRAQLGKRRPQHRRPRSATKPTPLSYRPCNAVSGNPFEWGGASLAGPGAEDAVRHLITDALTRGREHAIELVLTRPDACRLLGIAADDLQNERVPGLTLTDDAQQADAHLRRPGFSRRLLITYDGRDENPHSQTQQAERSAVLTVATTTRPSAQISADGEIAPCPPSRRTTAEPHTRVQLLPRPDAREQLLALPTLGRRRRFER